MSARSHGYYRFPTISGENVVFVADDDLWSVDAAGGTSRRLTANLAEVSHPMLSGDGEWLAFSGRDDGPSEIYVMPGRGGAARRLTYLGAVSEVVGWHGDRILFASNVGQPMTHLFEIFEIGMEGGDPVKVPCGGARSIAIGEGGTVIGRNTGELSRWKRYRGGTAGNLWIDREGNGEFEPLLELEGNVARPMWIGGRVYFMADHEGVGNLYSCEPDGKDMACHTRHRDFYIRNASCDGQRIVYHAGGDLYVCDGESSTKIDIEFHSPGTQRARRFCRAGDFLEDHDLNSDGSHVSIVARGRSFAGGTWAGAVAQQDSGVGARCRLTRWLPGDEELVLVCDRSGEDRLELHNSTGGAPARCFDELDIGRPIAMEVAPVGKVVALTNHRNEIICVDLESGEMRVVDRSRSSLVRGFDWSPDGRWLAYSASINHAQVAIHIYDTQEKEKHRLTEPVRADFDPTWDPKGRYLYFLSARVFDPVYDSLHFDLGFPKGIRPYLVTLAKDTASPFIKTPKPVDPSSASGGKAEESKPDPGSDGEKSDSDTSDDAKGEETIDVPPVTIDFEGIGDRILPFPVSEGLYTGLGASESRVFFMSTDPKGARGLDEGSEPGYALRFVDLDSHEEHGLAPSVQGYSLSGNRSALAYQHDGRIRVIRSGKDPAEPLSDTPEPGQKSGWVDLDRMRISIEPREEWSQMLHEAWRLQRDYFWVEDMAGVDWDAVLGRYGPLVDRLASRSEFSDLLWEMQGELGTSHAYELGGDYRPHPHYRIGFLGADLVHDADAEGYRIQRIVRGDAWTSAEPPPLLRPGIDVTEGDIIHAIDGKAIGADRTPGDALLNTAGQEIAMTVSRPGGDEGRREVTVGAIRSETHLRFREWVEANRNHVHERSGGRVGYVHIPDMGAEGYAEFHRYFLVEVEYEGLVVDVRHNRGGHVSPLLLEKLARRRQGYRLTRWMGAYPMPHEAPRGPVVAVTNEFAGSDGDIFSHAFKLLGLGPLVGKRTWGGVIGIWPRNWLVDGTVTTQPEFATWFEDVGWKVENYGTDPDIEVEMAPQDEVEGRDPQLDRAVDEAMAILGDRPNPAPDLGAPPSRRLPERDPS